MLTDMLPFKASMSVNPTLLTLPVKHAVAATPLKPKGRRCPYLFNATCDGVGIVVHTPGLMLGGYIKPGVQLLVKPESGKPRHSCHSLVAIMDDSGKWIGGNPSLGNQVARAAIKAGLVDEFSAASEILEERKIGNCRYDLCIEDWVIEVKSSSFCVDDCALFPVQLLTDLAKRKQYKEPTSSRFITQITAMDAMQDRRTCIMMIVQRDDCSDFAINSLDVITAAIVASSRCTKIALSAQWHESGECVFGKRLAWR